MVKAKIKDIKKRVQEQDKEIYGDVDNPEKDDDVGEMYKEVIGHEPKKGESLADEVEGAERFRRGQPAHEHKKRKK